MSQYFDNDKNIKSEKRLIKFNFNNKEFSIYSDNGVFSKDRFDYGTRVLLNSVDIDKLSGNRLFGFIYLPLTHRSAVADLSKLLD